MHTPPHNTPQEKNRAALVSAFWAVHEGKINSLYARLIVAPALPVSLPEFVDHLYYHASHLVINPHLN